MPIAFPPPRERVTILEDLNRLNIHGNLTAVPAPSMDAPNKAYTAFLFDAGNMLRAVMQTFHYKSPFGAHIDPARTSVVNPAASIDNVVAHGTKNAINVARVMGTLRMMFSGVSRDFNGATLGTCKVYIFRTRDNVLVGQTVSNGSGDWTFEVAPTSDNHFFVEYKAGGPDVFGTSSNTRVPVVIP